MSPKLYQKDGTTLIGTLTNCIECLVEEERNGIFEVTLQYPNNETISTSLVYDNIIICDSNDTLKDQKFSIYDTRRMMNNTIEVYSRHISLDLAYDHIDSIDITNQSCEYALNTIFRNSQCSTGYKVLKFDDTIEYKAICKGVEISEVFNDYLEVSIEFEAVEVFS